MPLRAVAFDLDNTLVDHDRAARLALAAWVDRRGWTAHREMGDRWIALEDRHFADYVAGRVDFEEHRRRRLRGILPVVGADLPTGDDDLDALFAEYRQLYTQNWVLYDDVLPALRRVAEAGLTVAVLTNGQPGQQHEKVARTGLAPHVDLLLTVADVPAPKPDPRAFATLCGRLGRGPTEVCFVGDDLDADVHGASAAGLPTVHLDRAGIARHSSTHTTIRTLADLEV